LNEDDRIGLQNEIDILTHVDHPNIVKLYEVYEDESHYSLVMELMTGGEVSFNISNCIAVRHYPRERTLQREGSS
jgi:serine/threonine protein kinase